MLRFLKLRNRLELVQHAFSAAQQTWGAYHLEFATHGSKIGIDPSAGFQPQMCMTSVSPASSAAR